MNQLLAVEFAAKYREFGAWFTEMTELTLRVDDQETAKSIRRKLAEMTIALDDAVYRPMQKQFPDLFDDC
jgi:hypothetical protein